MIQTPRHEKADVKKLFRKAAELLRVCPDGGHIAGVMWKCGIGCEVDYQKAIQ